MCCRVSIPGGTEEGCGERWCGGLTTHILLCDGGRLLDFPEKKGKLFVNDFIEK